jgi:hypothetical protein
VGAPSGGVSTTHLATDVQPPPRTALSRRPGHVALSLCLRDGRGRNGVHGPRVKKTVDPPKCRRVRKACRERPDSVGCHAALVARRPGHCLHPRWQHHATSICWPIIRSHTGLGHRWPRTHTFTTTLCVCVSFLCSNHGKRCDDVAVGLGGHVPRPVPQAAAQVKQTHKPQTQCASQLASGKGAPGQAKEACCVTRPCSCVRTRCHFQKITPELQSGVPGSRVLPRVEGGSVRSHRPLAPYQQPSMTVG